MSCRECWVEHLPLFTMVITDDSEYPLPKDEATPTSQWNSKSSVPGLFARIRMGCHSHGETWRLLENGLIFDEDMVQGFGVVDVQCIGL